VKTHLRWNGPAVKAAQHAAAARGLGKAVEHLLTESRAEVPIEEGTLERSGVASVDRDNLVGAVAYDTPYAVRQHEELEWRHAEGRNAKYLEGPMNRERETMLQLIAAEIRRADR
jgi:hypothetical protein